MDDAATHAAGLNERAVVLIGRTRRVCVDFLISDIAFAFAMLDRAAGTNDPETVRRSVDAACRAHEVVTSMLVKVRLGRSQREEIRARLRRLSDRLEEGAWRKPSQHASGFGLH